MEFLGIGLPELLVILILALLVVGPQRLPQTAAQIARFIRQVRRYATEVTEQLREEMEKLEAEYEAMQEQLRRTQEELRQARQEADKLVKAAAGLPEEPVLARPAQEQGLPASGEYGEEPQESPAPDDALYKAPTHDL